ncbi:TrkH family potassium uptake protein [Actibacterium sp. MT2.3-13A]|uniref:TrkH family potassium uptake protein n=1 Tax=Actibacterium sp. MT2.3-13A TaxID=2828332 RepID=UPI001BA474E8|nr:TrkH family potassium uptake protein [Actibacterium sp. MT2.3-13A]
MIELRPVGYVIGLLVAVLGVTMLAPMAMDLWRNDDNWMAFVEAAILTSLTGGLLALACSNGVDSGLTVQQAFLLTSGAWAVLPFFGALPFMFGAPDVGMADAYFEAMSGLTTTGATVFEGLDAMPAGVLLWRGILQWLGGLGIVIVAMVFLPVMRVGGMQFFKSEGFDTLGKVLPRSKDISAALIRVYVGLTLLCSLSYFALGMTTFEAVVHAMTTLSTGGFSTSDQSFGKFSGAAEYAAALFMVLASVPFVRLIQLMGGAPLQLFRDVQVRAYLRWIGYAVLAIVAHRVLVLGDPTEETVRETLFNVISFFSGTGYGSTDVTLWGPFAFVVLIAVGAIGGCTSSTGCSIKVFRYLVLFEAIRGQISRLYSPHRVVLLRLQGRFLEGDVVDSVIAMFTFFILGFGLLTIALSMTDLTTETAITAAWTSIFNVGPAFGPEVGPTGAMHAFPDSAKWLMSGGMLVGRLEVVAVLVLFMGRFWRG